MNLHQKAIFVLKAKNILAKTLSADRTDFSLGLDLMLSEDRKKRAISHVQVTLRRCSHIKSLMIKLGKMDHWLLQ